MPTEKLGPSGAQPRPSSIEEKAAGRALCGQLLWPPTTPNLSSLVEGSPHIPAALASALRRREPKVLVFRCFLLLLHAKKDISAKDAYTRVLLRLRSFGFVLRDTSLLQDEVANTSRLLVLMQPPGPLSLVQLVEVVKELDSLEMSVRLQPHLPIHRLLDDEETRQLCIRHWCQSLLDCCRFFPHFFQSHSRLLIFPASTTEEVEKLCQHLFLHGFAVLGIAHPVNEKTPKADAAVAVRGIGLIPAIEDGQASGSACSLGFPPGSKSFRSLAVALETKALPMTLTAVLGPAPVAKPKAVTPATVVKKAGLAPLVPIAPLPPPLPSAEKAVAYAPLLPATPLPPARRAGPPPPPEPPKDVPAKAKADPVSEPPGSPEDWIEFRDGRTGKAYFYNPVTKDSSWTRPSPKPPPPPPLPKPKTETTTAVVKAATGLIPGTKDPEESQPKVIDPKADAKAETKAVPKAPAPKRVDLVNDEPELSALIVFSDASSLGVADVTRELLWMSGCLLLHDGPCQLSKSQWRLLVGLTPEHPREREPKDGLDSAGWQSWFEHLQHQRHWLFVVRRSGAIALLQQICFGPSFRLMHRKRASYGALALRTSSRSTFLQLQESMRPWPSPMFLSLQALLFSPGDGKEAAPHVSPSAPVAGTACHSAIHAAAFVAEVVPELLQSQEVVLAVPASVNQADFDALKKTLTTKPMSYVELMSVAANDPVLMSEVPNIHPGKARCAFSLTSLHQGLGWIKNKDAWKLPEGQKEGLARLAVFSRMAAAREVEAYVQIFQRLESGLPAEDDGNSCSLQQAYSSLISKGAVLIWRPFDVDQLMAAVWPNHAVPMDGRISLALTDRSLRLADPWCGIGETTRLLPGGRPRSFSSWATDLVLEMSHGAGTEVSISERRLLVHETFKGDKQSSALQSTKQALRFLALLHLCKAGDDFRCALIQLPRGCAAKDHLWATVVVRDSAPWRSLPRHPDVYKQQTHLLPVKLTAAELKLLKLEGRVVAESMSDGKVQKGWRICRGGDLIVEKSDFAAQLLGIREQDHTSGEADSFAAALASLVTKSQEVSDTATLIFEKVTKAELAAMVPQRRALMVDLAFQARGEPEFLKDVIEVPRQAHMHSEAMLIGASLARLAVAKEVPLQPSETAVALDEARKVIQSSPEILDQIFGGDSGWLWQSSFRFSRVLCNEPVGDVLDAWRALSSEEKLTSDSEYFTDQFLSLSCYGELIDAVDAKCISIEGPLLARQVLVNFSSKEPSLRFWESFPVLSKPGRLAAQLWGMLRLDESLKSFGEARQALGEGFFRCYIQEAKNEKKGAAELRLRLHFVLVLLELIWFRRQATDHDLCPGFPAEVGLREVLRQEVLQTATCWKRYRAERKAREIPGAIHKS